MVGSGAQAVSTQEGCAGPCRVLNKRCALGQGYLFPVAEGSGSRWCWGDQHPKSGLVGHEKGRAVCVGTGHQVNVRVCVHDCE